MKLTLDEYKTILLKELEETRTELASLIEEKDTVEASVTTETADPDEVASNLVGIETEVAMNHVLEEKIKSITSALKRIELGVFGSCTKCGQSIDPARLNAFPSADTCITCSSHS